MPRKIYINENQFREIMKNSLLKESEDNNKGSVAVKNGVRVVADGSGVSKQTWERLKKILPVLTSSNDDSVNSFNLTRSQIAYTLWPTLDKDSARSKLSQKINGSKAWNESELNKIANIISGDIA